MESASSKDCAIFILLGQVNCGKSTLLEHLFFLSAIQTGLTLEEQFARKKERMLSVAREHGLIAIRENPLLEYFTHVISFRSSGWKLVVTNVPGHKAFTKAVVSGIINSDCAILVVSAIPGEYEVGISNDGQTRQHALLAFFLGIQHLIICVNKMDDKSVDWSQARFEEIRKELLAFLTKIGYKTENITFILTSAWRGHNVSEKPPAVPWYSGPTLVEAIKQMDKKILTQNAENKASEKPLRITISDFFKIGGIGTVVIGRVHSGTLKPGMAVSFAPFKNKTAEVNSIELFHEPLSQALPGYFIGFSVKGLSEKEIKRGDVVGDPANDPPLEVTSILAQVTILNHPTEIKTGYSPLMCCHTAKVACRFGEIKSKANMKTPTVIEENPKTVKNGERCLVTLTPVKPICVEVYSEYPCLGRFVLLDGSLVVGVGTIKSVTKQKSAV